MQTPAVAKVFFFFFSLKQYHVSTKLISQGLHMCGGIPNFCPHTDRTHVHAPIIDLFSVMLLSEVV